MWSLGLFKVSDPEDIPVAVDRHVCRFTYESVCGLSPKSEVCDRNDVKGATEVSREAEKAVEGEPWLKFPYYDCEEGKWKYVNRIVPGYLDEAMWSCKD